MQNNFFNDYTGLQTLQWWIGQVVDEKNWAGNENDKIHKRDDVSGWGKRYKVRIFGRDSKRKDTKDIELEMSEVLFPVTGGSGHAGAHQTANIRQGAYVIGFYKDGIDAIEPIIMGVLANNSQTRLIGKDPTEGFIPRSGFKGLNGDKQVSTKDLYAQGPSSLPCNESKSCDANQYTLNQVDQVKDGTPCSFIPKTKACAGAAGEWRSIQSAIKNLLALVNRIKSEVNSFIGAASNLNSSISRVVSQATNLISQSVKTIINLIRGFVINKINEEVSFLINLLPPNQRPKLNEAVIKSTTTVQCVLDKIIRGLVGLVQKLLNGIIDQYINAPLCAVEQFVSNLLGSVIGDITGAIQSAISTISSVLGSAVKFAGKALDALNIVSGVLSFLSCDEPPDCTMGDQWSFWNGASCFLDKTSTDLSSITSSLVSAGSSTPPCNTSQLPCGPPVINIIGSNGNGALANPVISATGAILGIDLVSGGSGYTSPPIVSITQNCDNGGGAVIESIIDTQVGSVIGFNIIDSGTGYLSAPDGSTGGNGVTLSNPCDTILKSISSGYSNAKKPGTVISVVSGDIVYLPPSTFVEVFDSNGNVVQTLNGFGQLTPITITSSGSFTSPDCVPDTTTNTIENPLIGTPGISTNPSNPGGSYPVILEIGDVIINNPGVNYDPEDRIVIEPDNGAVLTPIYNDVGSLTEVKIENPGIGFTDYPRIFIDSELGINAEIIPQFKIKRIGDLSQDQDTIPTGVQSQVIHVIDCVGKIPPKTTFEIVPR